MGLFDLFRRKPARRATVTEQQLLDGLDLDLYANSPTVHLCINRVASTIATLPIFVQVNGLDAPRTSMAQYLLGYQPNTYQTPGQFFTELVKRFYLEGNVFLLIQRDRANRPAALHLVDKCKVQVLDGSKKITRQGLDITADCIHIHNGAIWGKPIAEQIPDLIALENALLQFARGYFSNGLTPTTIVTLPAEAGISQEKYDTLKAAILAQFGAAKNHGRPIFRTSKDVDITTQESQNARNAMLVEAMEYVRSEIARHFHIPTAMLDSAKATNSIMESETRQYYAQAILPTAEQILQALNIGLLDSYYTGQVAKYDFSILLKPAPEAQARIMNIYRYAGVLTVNEIRAELGYQRIEGGDILPEPSNLQVPGATGEALLSGDKTKPTESNNQTI